MGRRKIWVLPASGMLWKRLRMLRKASQRTCWSDFRALWTFTLYYVMWLLYLMERISSLEALIRRTRMREDNWIFQTTQLLLSRIVAGLISDLLFSRLWPPSVQYFIRWDSIRKWIELTFIDFSLLANSFFFFSSCYTLHLLLLSLVVASYLLPPRALSFVWTFQYLR